MINLQCLAYNRCQHHRITPFRKDFITLRTKITYLNVSRKHTVYYVYTMTLFNFSVPSVSPRHLFTSVPQVRFDRDGFLLLILPSIASPLYLPTPLPKSYGSHLYHVGELCRCKCVMDHA